MSTICKVVPLLQKFTRDELLVEYNELLLKQIARCKCPEHVNENPIELPSIVDLNQQLTAVISEMLDWGLDNLDNDKSGDVRRLVAFIDRNCLAQNPNALFTILHKLESAYSAS